MNITSILGMVLGAGVMWWGMNSGHVLKTFINWHGVILVLGGAFAATLVNSELHEIVASVRAFFSIVMKPKNPPAPTIIPVMIELSRKSRKEGFLSLHGLGKDFGDGFLSKAIQVLIEGEGDIKAARWLLEKEINRTALRHREVQNIFRTVGILSPMFGLLGTLIGIVEVLNNFSDPKAVGPSMATAITSAFYGICMANFICVPVAGKLRQRTLNELLLKEMILEGLLAIHDEEVPSAVEGKLSTYLSGKMRQGITR